jgi:methyltransferase
MSVLYAVLAFVLVQRMAELALAAGNTRRLRALGAIELDAEAYPLFIVLHAGWLIALATIIPMAAPPSWPLIGLFGLLQLGRVWVIGNLGRRWTTRLMIAPEAPLVRTGPYRFCRHPNYLIVAGEIALLPLAFGQVGIAAIFSAANFALLARRICIEERALAPKRPSRQPVLPLG